jgi:transposase
MNTTTYGLDLAKRVFQVHWVEPETGEVKRQQLQRNEVVAFFERSPRGLVAMEACGSAHYWGRVIGGLGHAVKLVAAQFVRPFVKTNKTDSADAEAIWETVQRPSMRFVAVKSPEQQAMLGLHRIRAQLLKQRTMVVLQMRGLLYEYGVVVPVGWRTLLKKAEPILSGEAKSEVPEILRLELQKQLASIRDITSRVAEVEQRIGSWQRQEADCARIAEIPGVGRLTASAVLAVIGDAKAFRSGRELAAFLGLVPRQSGTGGRVRLLGISKRGDPYLRTLLIHGARSVMTHSKSPPEWVQRVAQRRPKNVAIVALANKMARTIWALLAHKRDFEERGSWATVPAAAV